MKALSLWQPWATLVALGEKQYETRSWSTNYRGGLAIHASQNTTMLHLARTKPFSEVLIDHGYVKLPLGAVLCVVELVDVFPVEELYDNLDSIEQAFGNYAPGRFAWEMWVVEVFDPPIMARGRQGLWEWNNNGV